jgi:hypothetical protein
MPVRYSSTFGLRRQPLTRLADRCRDGDPGCSDPGCAVDLGRARV